MALGGAIKAGRAYVELFADDSKLVRGLKGAKERLKAFGSTVSAIGMKTGFAGIMSAIPVVMAIKTYANFSDQMSAVGGVTKATAAELKSMTDVAKFLGRTTSFTASEVGELMVELGRANFKPDQINAMTGAVLNLARATQTETADAAKVMMATMKQFGLGAEQGTRVADAFTVAANNSFTTVELLGDSLEYSGKIASQFGMSIEETLAVLGTLGDMGIRGSKAGTALRRMMIATGAQSEKLAKIFGISFLDADKNVLPLIDRIEKIRDVTKNLGTGEQAKKFFEAFGLRGITGAAAATGNTLGTQELLAKLRGGSGESARVAKKMDDNLGGSFRKLYSAIEGIAIAIGESLTPALRAISAYLVKVSGSVTEFVEKHRTLVLTVISVIPAMIAGGAAMIVFGSAISAMGTILGVVAGGFAMMATVAGGVLAVVGALLSPIGLVVAAVAALGAIFVLNSGIIGGAMEAFGAIKGIALDAFGAIKDAMAVGDFSAAMKILGAALRAGWEIITGYLSSAWESFIASLPAPILGFASLIKKIFSGIAWAISGVFSLVKGFANALASAVEALTGKKVSIGIAMKPLKGFDSKQIAQEFQNEVARIGLESKAKGMRTRAEENVSAYEEKIAKGEKPSKELATAAQLGQTFLASTSGDGIKRHSNKSLTDFADVYEQVDAAVFFKAEREKAIAGLATAFPVNPRIKKVGDAVKKVGGKAMEIASGSMGSFRASSILRNLGGDANSPNKKLEEEVGKVVVIAEKQLAEQKELNKNLAFV